MPTSGSGVGTPISNVVINPSQAQGIRYAQAADFAAFWCLGTVLSGKHTGANGASVLTDTGKDFVTRGVKAGDFIRNNSDGSSAPITVVAAQSITAALTGGLENTWDTGEGYSIIYVPYEEAVTIELFLDLAAADIKAALGAAGADGCSLASWANDYLKKLNVIEAAVIHNCPCGSASVRWSDETKQSWLDWVQKQLDMIIQGDLELCAGETGKNYPALGVAQVNYGPFSEAEILWRQMLKNN